MNGSSIEVSASAEPKIWRSDTSITIPSADILTFAFANLGQYDETKPIWVDAQNPSSTISAREARATVRRLVRGFRQHGLRGGDCVCIVAYNNIWYPLLWLGVIGAGGVVSGANPALSPTELSHHFNLTNTKYLVVQSQCLASVEDAVRTCNISQTDIFLLSDQNETGAHSDGKQSWKTLLDHGDCDWRQTTVNHENIEETIAAYASTSGTTGLPKAAAISHRAMVAQTSMLEQHFKDKTYQLALVLPLRLGITTYLLPRFDTRDFTRSVRDFAITDTAVVPPILVSLLHLPHELRHHLETLRFVLCAGAPIAAAVQTQLYQKLSTNAVVAQVWGTTELGWTSMFSDERDMTGSVGRLLPGIQLKLMNEGIQINQDLQHGEAYVRSRSLFSGYRNDVGATASALDSDGFYRTGDRIYVQEDKLYIDGRIKDTMKVKGWQVSPTEIEEVLLRHPRIADAAVVGVPILDAQGLETTLPRAYVVTQPGHALNQQEIVDFAASQLVSYKKLTGGVVFVDKIPRNTTGKILRRLLEGGVQSGSPQTSSMESSALLGSDVDGSGEHVASCDQHS